MHNFRLYQWLVLAGLFALCLTGCREASEPQGTVVSAPIETIPAHMTELPSHPDSPGASEKYYRFSFVEDPDQSLGPAPCDFPLMDTLVLAAAYYAMKSEDYEVTLDEVLDAGYWPYDILPEGDPAGIVLSDRRCTRGFSSAMISTIGTPSWDLDRKASILNEFYAEYYFRQEILAQQATSDFTPVLPDELVPLSNFWINPVTGREFEPGLERGMIREVPVKQCLASINCRLHGEVARTPVPVINKIDIPYYPEVPVNAGCDVTAPSYKSKGNKHSFLDRLKLYYRMRCIDH